MLRRIRIAVSMLFALVALALCVLWVRSYFRCDTIYTASRTYKSVNGELAVEPIRQKVLLWSVDRNPVYAELPSSNFGFRYASVRGVSWPVLQYWSPVLIFAALSLVPWIDRLPHRYSVSTLLITMTLVALLLGALTWAAKRDFPVGSPRWWKKHRSQAVFHPGKGYKVPGFDGYFDGEGQPLESKSP